MRGLPPWAAAEAAPLLRSLATCERLRPSFSGERKYRGGLGCFLPVFRRFRWDGCDKILNGQKAVFLVDRIKAKDCIQVQPIHLLEVGHIGTVNIAGIL